MSAFRHASKWIRSGSHFMTYLQGREGVAGKVRPVGVSSLGIS